MLTQAEREALSSAGRKGALASWAKPSKAERSERGRKAALARAKNKI